MTECIPTTLSFASLGRQEVVANFDGGRLTSDAGALLLREADIDLGLTAALADCISDPRNPLYVIHEVQTMLAQRITGIALGYEDLNDHQTLREDPLFSVLAEITPDPEAPLASPSTLCRFENRITRASLVRMSQVFVEQFIASHKRPPKELVLDFDATDDRVHGQQEGRFFHGYYDSYCFLPLYVFCGDQLLAAYLRPSNIDGAKHSWALLKLITARLRRAWPKVKLIFRGDSGFCRWKMLRWCERNGIGYVVGLARNKVLERRARRFTEAAERAFVRTGKKQRRFHEIRYAADTWDQKRRVVVKAEHLDKGPNTRFVVTNLADKPQIVYDERYVIRGDMENRIKEQQLGLFADRTSCHKFLSNQFRLLRQRTVGKRIKTNN
ncbi:MAG: IS1380 family transposase, partial [Candidatus Omnitrophica bacterium]|nr:IS1380 family transposase [Candidatus Omnitrophota bacterium]